MKVDWSRFFDDLIIKVLKGLLWISQVIFLAGYNWIFFIFILSQLSPETLFYKIICGIIIIISVLSTVFHLVYYISYLFGEDGSYDTKYPLLTYLESIKELIIVIKDGVFDFINEILDDYKE